MVFVDGKYPGFIGGWYRPTAEYIYGREIFLLQVYGQRAQKFL